MPVDVTRTVVAPNVEYDIKITALQTNGDVYAEDASRAIYHDNKQWWQYDVNDVKIEWDDLPQSYKRLLLGLYTRRALKRLAKSYYVQIEIETFEASLDPEARYGDVGE